MRSSRAASLEETSSLILSSCLHSVSVTLAISFCIRSSASRWRSPSEADTLETSAIKRSRCRSRSPARGKEVTSWRSVLSCITSISSFIEACKP